MLLDLLRKPFVAALCGGILGAVGTREWIVAGYEPPSSPSTAVSAAAAPANAPAPDAVAAKATLVCLPNSTGLPGFSENPTNRLDVLLGDVLRRPEPENQPDPFTQAVDLLKADAAAREHLLGRYRAETDPYARQQMRALLSFVNSPEVISFGIELAGAGDAGTRQEGYDMLRTLQLSSDAARSTLTKALDQESDPDALKTAISALVPGNESVQGERAQIVEQLSQLEDHPSAEVRAENLLALSRWSPGQGNEERIYRGLVDSQMPLREAALTALFENPIQTPRMKEALFNVVRDPSGQTQTREMAAESLNSFDLSSRESDLLAKIRETLPASRP